MSSLDDSTCHTRKVTSKVFKDLFTPELLSLKELCEKNNMEIRMAGGAVRDILLGVVPHDIDFASTMHPDGMIEVFKKEGIRMLEYGARAVGHGTVSVRINDKTNYEITTTRSDVLTNGRHAMVEFHSDWRRDANRRDLTINSMFLGLDGTLYDYFNGHNDLMDKRVLFVGDPTERIREDFLRIMRYFRFYGRIKADPEDHDAKTLEVIGQNAEGLLGVAGERIWVELKKIVKGHFADHQMKHIIELEVGKHIGLPADCDPSNFSEVYNRVEGYDITEAALLSSLFSNQQQVDAFHKRLKLSRLEFSTITFIVKERDNYRRGDTKFYQDMIVESSERKQCLHRCVQLAAYNADRLMYDRLKDWHVPTLPFNAKVFLEAGIPKGKKISQGVALVRQKWKDSGFTSTVEELEAYARDVIASGQLS